MLAVQGLGVAVPLGARLLAAVRDASFSLPEGGGLALLGERGSGKGMAARAVAGLVPPPGRIVAGTVQVAGRVRLVAGAARRALNPVLRVGRQLAEGGGDAPALLHAVGLDASVATRFPAALDAVSALRVAVALALAAAPAVLVADEPTEGLDPAGRAAVLALLQRLRRERGMALLLATCEPAVAAGLCEDVVVMAGGRVVELGPTASVLARPMDAVTERLVAASRLLAGEGAPPRAASGPPVLEARGLRCGALREAGFVLGAGERLGILGAAGAGKSALAACLVGLRPPTAGRIAVAGAAMAGPRPSVRLLFSDPAASLDRRRRVGQSLADAAPGPRAARRVREVLGLVGLPVQAALCYPHGFDAGELLRIAIARALMPRPLVLVADDPLATLDPGLRAEGLELLCRLQGERGFALLLLSREPGLLRYACGRVLALEGGRLAEIDSAAPACQDRGDATGRT